MTEKRKRVVMTIEKKVEAIMRFEEGQSMKSIAEEFNVGSSTVSDWIKNKEKLINHASKSGLSASKFKVMKKCAYEQIDEAILVWFNEQREKDLPVTGPLIREKAASMAKDLGITGFLASEGWLSKWKNRHNVRQTASFGGKLSLDSDAAPEYFKEEEEEFEDETVNNEVIRISAEEAFRALDVALKYVEQHELSTPGDVMLLSHWRGIAARESVTQTDNNFQSDT